MQHQTTGDLLLVTELMKGGSLYHALERLRTLGVQQLPHQSLLRISQHITNGLSYLHASDFSFGDLKSMNVLLSEPPDHTRATFSPAVQAKLCDFGLSRNLKHLVSPDSKHGPNETHIPARHGPAGTFAYLAPEAFSGLPVDDADAPKAADIYALGIVLWELATLKRPWPGRQPLQLIRLVKKEARRPDWPHDVSSLPHGFVDMVEKCWSQDPRLRPTAEDVSAMLDGMQQRVSGSCSSTQWSFSRESLLSRTTDDVDETSLSVDLGAVHVDDEYDRSHHGPTDFCGGDVDDFGLFEPPTIRHVRSVKVLPFEDLASDISGVTSAIQTTSNSNSRFSMDSFSQESVRKESSLDSRSRNYRVPWNASEQMANADNMLRSFEEEDLNVDNIGISLYTRPHFR